MPEFAVQTRRVTLTRSMTRAANCLCCKRLIPARDSATLISTPMRVEDENIARFLQRFAVGRTCAYAHARTCRGPESESQSRRVAVIDDPSVGFGQRCDVVPVAPENRRVGALGERLARGRSGGAGRRNVPLGPSVATWANGPRRVANVVPRSAACPRFSWFLPGAFFPKMAREDIGLHVFVSARRRTCATC
jgi:hypothetical protein